MVDFSHSNQFNESMSSEKHMSFTYFNEVLSRQPQAHESLASSGWLAAGLGFCSTGGLLMLTPSPAAFVGSLLLVIGCDILLACVLDWASRGLQDQSPNPAKKRDGMMASIN